MFDPWLPRGYCIDSEIILRKLLFAGDNWQIYDTVYGGKLLLGVDSLVQKWTSVGFLPSDLFSQIKIKGNICHYLCVDSDSEILPIASTSDVLYKSEILSIAMAMKRTREIEADTSLHDALFVEKYTILLPTYSVTEGYPDEMVLGKILTCGAGISITSFKRLISFCTWFTKEDIIQIIKVAGLSVPGNDEQKGSAANSREDGIEPKQNKNKGRFLLPGRPNLEAFFNDHIIDIIENSERYEKMGISFPSAAILYGPPGCGKTFAVEKLVEYLDIPSYTIDSNSIGSPYIHQTGKLIAEVFGKAMETAPSVVVIDEMEAFVSDRQTWGTNKHGVEEVAEFLRLIPKAISKKVLVIGMTNHLDMIDPAIRRRGRFDYLIEVGMPSKIEVESLVKSLVTKLPVDKDIKLDDFIDKMTGKPLSDTTYVLREAARITAKAGKNYIDQESLNEVLKAAQESGKKEEKRNRIGFQ